MKKKITLIAGDAQVHYISGLISGLYDKDLDIELIANSEFTGEPKPNVKVINLRGDRDPNAGMNEKVLRILRYYLRLFLYISTTDSKIIHLQSFSRFETFDRTALLLWLSLFRKKVIYTFHDLSQQIITSDKWSTGEIRLNKIQSFIVKFMRRLINTIVVHNKAFKENLTANYGYEKKTIFVIPHGINNIFSPNILTKKEARRKLDINISKKVLLFFGNIAANKGLDLLLQSFKMLANQDDGYFLLIAGAPRAKHETYMKEIFTYLNNGIEGKVKYNFNFIPDDEIPVYFKAADCVVLPYKAVCQSGVLYLSYSLGRPVIASRTGNFEEEIIEGKTGFLFKNNSAEDLIDKLTAFFKSDIYRNEEQYSKEIYDYSIQNYDWREIGKKYYELY